MKSKRLLLLLLLALCLPWAANAQQTTKTVHQGTNTSRGVPMYAYYFDEFTKSQHVIPAADLENMSGGTITSITYYYYNGGDYSGQNPFSEPTQSHVSINLYITEVESASISSLMDFSSYTPAYTGYITYETDGTVEITLDHSYIYGGGNLMIGVENPTKGGSGNYDNVYFYGKTGTQGASTYSNNSNSASSITYKSSNTSNFLPYTTFTYTPAATPTSAPGVTTSETIADLTNVSVKLGGTITDMGGANSVQAGICYSTTSEPTTADGHVQSGCMSTGAYTRNITGLLPGTTYYFRAYAYSGYNSLENPTYGDIYSFTTAGNITLTQPANGTISVSVNGGTATTSSTYASQSDQVTLTATPADGYSLDCWNVTGVTGTASGNTYTFEMPANNVTVTASIIPTSGGSSSETYYALASSIESGEKYLVVNGNGTTASASTTFYAMEWNNTSSTSGLLDYGTPTFKDTEKHKITDITPHVSGRTLSDFVWTITASGSDYTLSAQNGESTYYLIETTAGDGNLHAYTTSTTGYDSNYINWTIEKGSTNNIENEYFVIHNPYWHTQYTSGTRYYHLYKASGGFENYYVTNTAPASQTGQNYRMYLYKLTSVTNYAIVATANPSEGGTIAGSDYYASGESCTLTATPAFGYDFVSWTEGGEIVSLDAAYTFTVSGARTLVANFESQGSCIKPTDLAQVGTQAAHQAQLSWTENSGATQWQVVYSTDSEFNPDDATPVTVNENPATITTGLNQASTYYFRVRAICDQNSQSGWSNQGTFSTISGHLAPTVSYDPTTLSTHEVTVTWTGVATNVLHQSYDLYYSTNSVMPATLDPTTFIVGLTGNSHPLTDLTSGTQYYVWVRDNCGDDGYSDWSTPESFITVCEPKTITDAGWGENFNDYTGTAYSEAGVMPNCWDAYTANSYKPHVISTSSTYYNYSTTNALVMPGGSNYSYVALPEFTNDLQTLQISFKYGFYDYDYGTLNLGYIKENDVNFSTFTPFKDFTATTDWTLIESGDVYLQTLPTDAYRLAFRYDDDYGYGYYVCNIEDVVISLIPTCWQPQNLAASEVTNESAKLTWERHAMGDETAWVLQYGEDNTFATCTTVNVETNPTYTIESGLNPETTYYARVKPACDTEGNLWTEVEFETEPDCAIPTGLAVTPGSETPHGATITWNGRNDRFVVEYATVGEPTITTLLSEDFEGSNDLPTGWTTTNTNWQVSSGNKAGGAAAKEAELSYTNSTTPWRLVTPAINLTGLTSVNLSFKHYVNVYQSYSCTFGVATSSDGGTTWNTGWTQTYTSDAQETINVEAFTTSDMGKANVLFCFFYSSDAYNMDNWYIDDIVIKNEVPGEITWHTLADGTIENTTPGELGTFSYTFNDATLFEPNTTYAAHVKGACGSKTTTDFCEPVYFTTADDCPVPAEFAVSALTSTTATVTWNGGFATEWKVWIKKNTDTEYPAEYATVTTASKPFDNLTSGTKYFVKIAPTCDETKTLEGSFTTSYAAPFVETFDAASTIPANWAIYNGSVDDAFNGTNPTTGSGWAFSNTKVFGTYHARINSWNNYTYWLTTPNIDLTSATDASKLYLLFDLATTDYDNENAPGSGNNDDPAPGDDDQFRVLVSTNGGTTWTEDNSWVWMNEGGDYDYSAVATKGQTIMLPLASYASGSVMIAFYTESGSTTDADFDVHIDNVRIGEVSTLSKTITGVGADNWADPDFRGGYYLIASPFGTVYTADVAATNMITDPVEDYDLYYFDQAQNSEWRNYKAEAFNLTSGKGYLYSNKSGGTVNFTGIAYNENGEVNLAYSETNSDANMHGWNLVGNPFATTATLDKPYFKLNDAGDTFDSYTEATAVEPMDGLFVQASATGEKVTFTKATTDSKKHQLNMNLREGNRQADNAIIRFDGGQGLEKFSFREGSSRIYITEEGKDYAVVNAGQVGEIPVSFKAENNGSYTLSFTNEEVTFSYLHLIDNMNGNDVNLLETPSYSFDALTTDYASRFRLVFATGTSVDGDNFSFINGMGNLCIFGIEGEATVQVIDALGHVLSSETFSGSYERKINGAPGVYMIRLINGNDVKVQKMIVR